MNFVELVSYLSNNSFQFLLHSKLQVGIGNRGVFTGLPIKTLQQSIQPEREEIDHFAFALHEHFCLQTSQMLGCVEYKMVYLNAEHMLAELIHKY